MKSCETCVNRDTCKKDIGFIFGFCNIDYKPIDATEKSEATEVSKK